jgi:hypothetical protein
VQKNEGVIMQIFVSERTLNSALMWMHAENKIAVKFNITSVAINTFFPNFESVYGHNQQI